MPILANFSKKFLTAHDDITNPIIAIGLLHRRFAVKNFFIFCLFIFCLFIFSIFYLYFLLFSSFTLSIYPPPFPSNKLPQLAERNLWSRKGVSGP